MSIETTGLIFNVTTQTLEEVQVIIPDKTLEELKSGKLADIRSQFEYAIKFGRFMTTSLGENNFEVDCRRNERDNDLQNIDGMIELVSVGAVPSPILWKGVGETKSLTLSELQSLKIEMLAYGANVYQKKHILESQIAAATIESINLISW